MSATDQLNGWRLRAVGLKSGKTSAIVYSGAHVYVATRDSGIHIFNGSAGGNDLFWNPVNNGLSELSILSLAALDSNTLYAGTVSSGLFRTNNQGQNWSAVNNAFFNGKKITAIEKAGNRIIVATDDNGLFATDDGLSWFDINDINTTVSGTKSISYNSLEDEIMVLNSNGLFTLANASTTNTYSYSNSNGSLGASIEIRSVSNNGQNWYLATDNGVYTSDASQAINWNTENSGLTTLDIHIVIALNNTLVAGSEKAGVFKSDVNPVSWSLNNTGVHGISNIKTYSVTGKGDSITVTATEYGIVFSNNLGNTPQIRNNGLTDSLNINDVEFAENYLLAATQNGGVFWSTDLGLNWQAINSGLSSTNITRLAYSNNYKYLIDDNGTLFRSALNSTTWENYSSGTNSVHPITSICFYAENQYVGTLGGGVYRKTMDENTWIAFSTGLPNLNITAITASAGIVYAGTNGSGIFKSDIDNANWSATNPISIAHFNDVTFLQPNHIQYMTSYNGYMIASFKGGVVATVNEGNTWIRGGHQFHLPSYSNIHKIGFINSRIMVTTDDNSMMSNSLVEFVLIDTLLHISKNQVTFEAAGGQSIHAITSNVNWQISSNQPWATLSIDSGNFNRTIVVNVDANTGANRTATITLMSGTIVRTLTVNQNGLTGISSIEEKNTFALYPNPNKGRFTIDLGSIAEIKKIEILDTTGKLLLERQVNAVEKVDFSGNFNAGLYFIKVYYNNTSSIRKMIVE
jgi:photosystem II stability/assembly factor-like uncharacterized protein